MVAGGCSRKLTDHIFNIQDAEKSELEVVHGYNLSEPSPSDVLPPQAVPSTGDQISEIMGRVPVQISTLHLSSVKLTLCTFCCGFLHEHIISLWVFFVTCEVFFVLFFWWLFPGFSIGGTLVSENELVTFLPLQLFPPCETELMLIPQMFGIILRLSCPGLLLLCGYLL